MDDAKGRQIYFQADTSSPLFAPVRDLVRQTIGAAEVLRRHLAGLAGVESAVIFGSYSSGTMRPTSDIDLLLVGDLDRDDLTDRLEAASRELGRPVNGLVITAVELGRRRTAGDGLLASIDAGQTIPVLR